MACNALQSCHRPPKCRVLSTIGCAFACHLGNLKKGRPSQTNEFGTGFAYTVDGTLDEFDRRLSKIEHCLRTACNILYIQRLLFPEGGKRGVSGTVDLHMLRVRSAAGSSQCRPAHDIFFLCKACSVCQMAVARQVDHVFP